MFNAVKPFLIVLVASWKLWTPKPTREPIKLHEFKFLSDWARGPNPMDVSYIIQCGDSARRCCTALHKYRSTHDETEPLPDEAIQSAGAWLSGRNSFQFVCCRLSKHSEADTPCLGPYKKTCQITETALLVDIGIVGRNELNMPVPYSTKSGVCIESEEVVKDTIQAGSTGCLDVPEIAASTKDVYIYLWFTVTLPQQNLIPTNWAKITPKGSSDDLLHINSNRATLYWGPATTGVAYQGCILSKPGLNTILHIRLGGADGDF